MQLILPYVGRVTKEFLLERNTQETYMEYYLDMPVKKGLSCSPLRNDKTPTCSFYWNKSGDLIYKDFSGQFYGNFIAVVMKKYGVKYSEALNIIAADFGYIDKPELKKTAKPIPETQSAPLVGGKTRIQVQVKDFDDEELQWWGQYGISKEVLDKFNVYSCDRVFLNGEIFTASTSRQRIYGYYRGKRDAMELWRIYFPGRTSYKFLSNWKAIHLQGSQQLPKTGDLLVVTKSMKDVMTLYSLGITAIAPNSENLFMSESQYKILKKRFSMIVLFYDNDLAGIHNMNKFRKQPFGNFYNLPCLWIPRSYGAKDISDFYKMYGKDKTLELINNAKERLSRVDTSDFQGWDD